MGLILSDWKHLLRSEISQKSLSEFFCYNNKVTREVKDYQNSLIKKFTWFFNLIVLNTTNFSNSFHSQTSLKDTIFTVLISGVKLFLIGLRNALMDSYILSIWYKIINLSLSVNLVIHRAGNETNILCSRCKRTREVLALFYILLQLSKITLRFRQWNNQSKIDF